MEERPLHNTPSRLFSDEFSTIAFDAISVARYFGNSARFWLNLQLHYDLEHEQDELGNRLQEEVKELQRS